MMSMLSLVLVLGQLFFLMQLLVRLLVQLLVQLLVRPPPPLLLLLLLPLLLRGREQRRPRAPWQHRTGWSRT
jgi:hypothetical protein